MNLKLVTFDVDLTQFLIEATTDNEAVDKAIEINRNEEMLGGLDDWLLEDVVNRQNYTVVNVDMNMLWGLMLRHDICGVYNNVIVFVG